MKVKAKHILIVFIVSAVLFYGAAFLFADILTSILINRGQINYTISSTASLNRMGMNFGLAFGLLPIFTYIGWLITKLSAGKQRQAFVGIQAIVFFVAGLYWYLNYKQQMADIPAIDVEGAQIQVTVPLEHLMLGEFMIGGAVIGFLVALGLSVIIKKIK